MKKFAIILPALLAGIVLSAAPARAALKVVATTQDLESLAKEVGGDKVETESLAKGYQDPHQVEPKPSFVLKLNKADLLIVVGRELEIGWLPPLINQARNPKIQPSADRYLDASNFAHILEIPTGQITRAMGDVHPQGNPHYWLSPENGRRIAQGIQKKLAEISPADAPYFAQRYADFDRRLGEAEKRWNAEMAPYRGTKIVTYHRSWPNFVETYGLNVVGYVEPKPGIPPSPSHTFELTQEMKKDNVKMIIIEPYFDSKTPNAIGRDTGAQVVTLAPSVGGAKGAPVADYIQLFDYDVRMLVAAFQAAGVK
ncbi:MAG TPA: metal ABC transporter substrate-binding protein [Vicinamibacterales bacterium]|jgi:zinc/manganese transport system substrate-binding protein|nr:metal ABC transporter substrate-binding protein [Vicinamibacterales bacterium]